MFIFYISTIQFILHTFLYIIFFVIYLVFNHINNNDRFLTPVIKLLSIL